MKSVNIHEAKTHLSRLVERVQAGEEIIIAAEIRDALEENGFQELPVAAQHAIAPWRLPPIHSDPFDRMLVAQAIVEPMALMTSDARLGGYPATIEVF